MAGTNRVKGAVRPPAWAARAKLRLAHVRGGPAEAAALIHRGQWDKAPAGLVPVGRYGIGFTDELAAAKIDAVCLTWSPGFSLEGDVPQWELIAKLLPLLKKKKIRVIAEFSLTGCFAAELLPRVPEARSWLERRSDGKPIAHANENCLQMNVQHEGWRQYLAHKVRMAAGAGFDGFFFTDVVCQPADGADFLAMLKEAAQIGRIPETDDFLFYTDSVAPDVVRATNIKWVASGARPPVDAQTFGANIPGLKALFELGGRDRTMVCGIPDAATEKEARLAAAEVLACGGVCNGLRVPPRYRAFHAEHADIFAAADPVNTLAILADDEGGSFARLKSDLNLLDPLLRNAIQFDVIPISDFASFDLRKYRVLSAMHIEKAPEPLDATLKAFATHHGGAVLYSSAVPESEGSAEPTAPAPRTETPEGKGVTIRYTLPLRPETKQLWLDDLHRLLQPPPVSIESGNLAVLVWGKGTRRWVHLLNYASKPCDATIALPGCGGRKLKVLSPDEKLPELTILETGSANARFTIKNMDTYAVVEVE